MSFSARARPGYARLARRLRRRGPALRAERQVDRGDGRMDVSDGAPSSGLSELLNIRSGSRLPGDFSDFGTHGDRW